MVAMADLYASVVLPELTIGTEAAPTDWKSILSEYANINYRFTQAFAYGILAGIKKLTIALLKGHIKYAKGYASTVFSLLKQSKAVIQVRKQTKQIHASYL